MARTLAPDGVTSGANFTKQQRTISNIAVKEAGYIFVYLSYESQSNNYVYFDDLKITHTPGNLVQANEYYPGGMQTERSWTREEVVGNKILYTNQELQPTLDYFQFEERFYDFQLLRWNAIDKKAENYSAISPYSYVAANPINNVDEKGMWTVPIHYEMTFTSLLKVGGLSFRQMDLLADYSSTYVDHPNALIGAFANYTFSFGAGLPVVHMHRGIDYKATENSQILDWSPESKHENYNIWHSMMSEWEETNGMSPGFAMQRGLEAAWTNLFKAAESGIKLNNLKRNTKEIDLWGRGMHGLQDAYAHRGSAWHPGIGGVDFGHLNNDMSNRADMKISDHVTDVAVTVYQLLTRDFASITGDRIQIIFGSGGSGMTTQQFDELLNRALEWLASN